MLRTDLMNARASAPLFRLSCWLLGLMAFVQVLACCVGLVMRVEKRRLSVDRDHELTSVSRPSEAATVSSAAAKPAISPTNQGLNDSAPPRPSGASDSDPKQAVVSPSELGTQPDSMPADTAKAHGDTTQEVNLDRALAEIEKAEQARKLANLPSPSPLAVPLIADPVTERLVKEARQARLADDMIQAIPKLQEALQHSPDDANVLFELGLAHESMGVNDRATEYYQRVFELGTVKAGALYVQAAQKLRDGFEQPEDKKIRLGRVRVFRDERCEQGQRVILTIPVQSVPGEAISDRDLEVRVHLFDEVGETKELQPAATDLSKIEFKWVSGARDWLTGEELLQVSYTILPQTPQQKHLFGERRYHGQVVELTYKGELIDALAWPRVLAHRMNKPEQSPDFSQQDLPAGENPVNPLLPGLPPQDAATPAVGVPNGGLPPLPVPPDALPPTQP